MKKIILPLLLCMCLTTYAASVPDYAKEQRWAEQVEDSLLDGDAVLIEGADKAFFGIWTESEESSTKAAIILHGSGVHPNWDGVIRPIRVGLTTKKYNTLAIQLPVLANGVDSDEYTGLFFIASQRINAAGKWLQQQGYQVDLLLAHSLGSSMATHYLAHYAHPFKQFIGVGMNASSVAYLPKINVPILDLYGTNDIKPVLNSVVSRANASKHNKNYTQQQITGDHFFNNEDETLLNTIYQYLELSAE